MAHVLYSERLTSLGRVEGQREKHDKAGRFKLFVNGSPKQQALYSRTLSLERTSLASKSMTGGCVREGFVGDQIALCRRETDSRLRICARALRPQLAEQLLFNALSKTVDESGAPL